MAYQRILVAIDLTDEADEVLAAAQQQANFQETPSLHLINVVKPLHHTHGGLDMGAVSASVNLDKQLHDRAKEFTHGLAEQYNIPTEHIHLKTGNPAAPAIAASAASCLPASWRTDRTGVSWAGAAWTSPRFAS